MNDSEVGVVLLLAVCGLGSWVGTGLVRRYALARSLLDIPNERSSHTIPTPRGGGLAVAVAALSAFLVAAAIGAIDWRLAFALVLGGAAVAGIGWVDDHSHVAARWRSLVHGVSAALAVWLLGGISSVRVGESTIQLGLVGSVLAVVGIVWLINLYNFMDGIDGIAGGEAALVGTIGALFSWYAGAASIAVASALVAAAAAGFLAWNWPPARIFMGDAGSGMLGFLFAVLAVASEVEGGPPLLVWFILLAVFIVDATITLARRVLNGEQWYSAHRSHAYQRAVQAGWSHSDVLRVVLALDLILGGIAGVALIRGELVPLLTGVALLVVVSVYFAVERLRPMYANNRVGPPGA